MKQIWSFADYKLQFRNQCHHFFSYRTMTEMYAENGEAGVGFEYFYHDLNVPPPKKKLFKMFLY